MTPGGAGAPLYSPDILGLAVSLAQFPLDDTLPLRGEARSRACGSSILMGCSVDEAGVIGRIGLRTSACAVGQAAAALFAVSAAGQTRDEISVSREALKAWLGEGGPVPDWPGIHRLAPALAYPGRHGAIMLPWDAALVALPKA